MQYSLAHQGLILILILSCSWAFSPHWQPLPAHHNNNNCLLERVDAILREATSNQTQLDSTPIVQRVLRRQEQDYQTAVEAPLVLEKDQPPPDAAVVEYEWLLDKNQKFVLQSHCEVLNATARQAILAAAQDQFEKSSNSRFTYQYSGNSEAHLADFDHPFAIACVNQLLASTIYPLIRKAFWNGTQQLYVYDGLVIRYNATTNLAGQPLHRDFGLVSINIPLSDSFQGGGTFFEDQLPFSTQPIRPPLGHCVAHYANARHAGAGTRSGVRDILVLFVTANTTQVQRARYKDCRSICEKSDNPALCRLRHHRLAVSDVDGEAYQYLGHALMDMGKLDVAIACLYHAALLTPNDARVYNNLGIALSRKKWADVNETDRAYQRGIKILQQSQAAGCLVEDDLDQISLNYGLHLSKQDRFQEASEVLESLTLKDDESKIVQDALRLWKFCRARAGNVKQIT